MQINEITEKECREILARASVGRLACSRDNQPYIVPMYFACEAEYIYAFSTAGQKIEWMRANPLVCVETEESNDSQWVSVIANGSFQELPEARFATERAHARKLLQARHEWWLNALAERRMKLRDQLIEPVFFRIHVDSVSGLRGQP